MHNPIFSKCLKQASFSVCAVVALGFFASCSEQAASSNGFSDTKTILKATGKEAEGNPIIPSPEPTPVVSSIPTLPPVTDPISTPIPVPVITQSPIPTVLATIIPKPTQIEIGITPSPTASPTPNITTYFSTSLDGVQSSIAKHNIWAVNSSGTVTRFSVKDKSAKPDDEVYEVTGTWQLEGGGSGHRTYVSEAGLLIGKTNTGIYRVDDDVSQNTPVKPIWKPTTAGNRFCVTSYKKPDGKSYVGIAYTSSGKRMFTKIPIDLTLPNKLDTAKAVNFSASNAETPTDSNGWGYSCFIDQARGIFWSQYAYLSVISGFDVIKEVPIAAKYAKNAKFPGNPSIGLPNNVTSTGSYAMSGDNNGNLLNSNGTYTMAHEPLSKMIFRSTNNTLTYTKEECFSSKTDCKNNIDHFLANSVTKPGPLSSLNDGRVAVISRGNPSKIYLISLVDISKPNLGLKVKTVGQFAGDGYMYTDFTGATLYAADLEKTLSLANSEGFKADQPIKKLTMRWLAASDMQEDWKGLNLQVRCYSKENTTKPAFADITVIPQASIDFDIPVAMCKGTIYNSVDIHISPKNASGSDFTRTKSFVISGEQ